jgi:hypothetical protein
MVSQHVVGLIVMTPEQIAAGKVAGLGTLSSFDAALIAQKVVGICSVNNQAGEWRFTAPPSIFYSSVLTDYFNQNYKGYLMGDVSGEWGTLNNNNRPAMMPETPSSAQAVKVAVPSKIEAVSGSELHVPVAVGNLAGREVSSYQFDIAYDPAVLSPANVAASLTGTIGEGLSVVSNAPEPGLLKVAVYGAVPVAGDGVYADLIFKVTGVAGESSAVRIADFRFNDGGDEVYVANGIVAVTPSPNSGTLAGRLFSPFGKAIANTSVMLANTEGRVEQTTTDAEGRFRFAALSRGGTYTVSARSSSFTFTPVTVSIIDDVTNVDLIANP